MAGNKLVRFGPIALTNSAANLLNPPTLTGGVGVPGTTVNCYYLIRHVRILNKTAGAVTCSFYIGATGASAAGTESIGTALSVPANSYVDVYPNVMLDVADFLVGLASANTSLVFEAHGEIGVR